MPFRSKFLDDGGQPIFVKTLAQRVIELHVQPAVNAADFIFAGGQKFLPKTAIFGIAGVQLGGFVQQRRR